MTVRYGQAAPDDAGDLMDILIPFYNEVGRAPLDLEKMAENVAHVLTRGVVVIARDSEAIIGVLGLVEEEIWYSRSRRIINPFFVVHPHWRGGRVGSAMLKMAQRLAEDRGSLLEIDVINLGRARGRIADKLGFVPVGYLSRFGDGDVPAR